MILPSVFVQILTQNADLVPSKSNASQSAKEIKAEPPFKSEVDNANQSQAFGTARLNKDLPSIPEPSSKNQTFSPTPTCSQSNLTANLVTARPKVKCFKCEQCPFMSISQDGYNNHIQTVHNNDRNSESISNRSFRNKILCPGCENVFYSKMSLKIHLVNDHQMSRPEISQLMESLFLKKSASKSISSNEKTDSVNIPKTKGAEKQKIYLKNVEVLQNPRFNGCQFGGQNTSSPTILSPSETQSECSSNLTDEIAKNDASIVDELNFNRMPVRNQLDNNCLYQHITDIESTFPMVSSTQSHECLNMTDNRERMPMNAISPIIEIASIDDPQANRPDSGSSVKFSENFLNTECIWPVSTTVSTSSTDFLYQHSHHTNLDQQPSIKISSNLNQTPSVSPLPSVPLNERKKIYIKNIDILKEPLIKSTQDVSLTDSNCRKNTLHLRTVDEVNLLINKPHENNSFNPSDGVTLNEDEYRYVLNDANEYNNIIPQYLENDVSDFMFSNEPQVASNPVEYYNGGSNSNYANTNLDASSQSYATASSTYTFDSITYESQDRPLCNGILSNIPNSADLYPTMNHSTINLNGPTPSEDFLDHDDGNHFFANKCMPMKAFDSTDYMIVSSEAIIDILDLTNDEVEQILDDNLISPQDFEMLNSPRLSQSSQPYNRIPRINLATNLTKVTPPQTQAQYEGKSIDMRPLETPTIDLVSTTTTTTTMTTTVTVTATATATEMDAETNDIAKLLTMPVSVNKKKSGRTKGARQINGISNRNNVITTKCSISNCGMRFATQAAIVLHEQCHSSDSKEIRCPKCQIDTAATAMATAAATIESTTTVSSSGNDCEPSTTTSSNTTASSKTTHNRNWNWNTLHTHLWREHNIDMELFQCPHCPFKTPILSRLKNTHMKIHSDTRDFKCDYCPKAFKNARQMKNHRRIHTRSVPPAISTCKYCGQSFYSAKHLKEHYFTHNEAIEHQRQPFALQCDICSDTFSSKHALRTHHLNHFEDKRFNCDECDYKSNDHNAFRRHQMVHSKEVKYKCSCCAFQCIQSTNYKNHILKNHPESAKELMYMCDKCNFVTVNKRMYDMHCLNHNNNQMSSVESN